jgi:predicted peptidase
MKRIGLMLKPGTTLAVFASVMSFGIVLAGHAQAGISERQQPHSFTKEIRKTVSLNYLLYLPKEYEQDKGKKWPLILFLHGSGERGSDIEKVKSYGPPGLVSEGKDMPFIIVSPQAPERTSWDPDALTALLDEVEKQYAVDTDRIYVTGVSMGGSGTWRLAAAHPERFAAIAPICGTGDPSAAPRLAHLPVWVFHGAKDDQVPLQASQEMVDALKEAGNEARFTVYPEAGHDSWTQTYNNSAIFDWLLAQRRSAKTASGH